MGRKYIILVLLLKFCRYGMHRYKMALYIHVTEINKLWPVFKNYFHFIFSKINITVIRKKVITHNKKLMATFKISQKIKILKERRHEL